MQRAEAEELVLFELDTKMCNATSSSCSGVRRDDLLPPAASWSLCADILRVLASPVGRPAVFDLVVENFFDLSREGQAN
eukprot:5865754-Pleurochrysis_carterae.AAC.2